MSSERRRFILSRPRAFRGLARAEALIDRFDDRLIGLLRRWSAVLLRLSLGAVFIWFGALKLFEVSPVADLVARTVYWVDPSWFVPLLGAVEIGIGIGLVAGRGLRLVLLAFAVQMLGTFLVLPILPDVAFQGGNPLLLTVEGEFVVKNLVLLAAGLVIGSQLKSRGAARHPRAGPGTERGDLAAS